MHSAVVKRLTAGAAALITVSLGLLPCAAHADIDYFPYTYDWLTPDKGEAELEIRHTAPTDTRHFSESASLEYGVTDRYMIEPYVYYNYSGGFRDFPRGGKGSDGDDETGGSGSAIYDPVLNGPAYRYYGYSLEQRYRFGNFALKKPLFAAYLEYEQFRGIAPELEGKWIVQYNPNLRTILAGNLIVEQEFNRSHSDEYGYSLGVAYFPLKRNQHLWIGGEALGNWSENNHYAGPTVGYAFDDRTRLTGTLALQSHGDTGSQFRIQLSHQFN